MKAAVLEAALRLVEERGVAGFSIAEVATRAGVHETTIYRRWKDKERLLVELLQAQAEQLIPEPNTGFFREDMVALLEASVAFCRSDMGTLVLRSLGAVGVGEVELKQRYWRPRLALLDRVIARAVTRGELAALDEGRLVAEAMLSPIFFRLLVSGEPLEAGFPRRVVSAVLGQARR